MLDSAYFSRATSDTSIRRSLFKNNKRVLTTFNAGFLVPIAAFDVLPSSTWRIDLGSLVRESTPIHPVMDDAFLEVFAFYVPNRQVFDQTKQMFGEPMDDPYAETPEIVEPVFYREEPEDEAAGVTNNPGYITRRSLAAYYGVPVGSRPYYINAKYARGYGKIWNRWFRAEELQQAIDVPTDGIDRPYYRDVNVDGVLPDVQADPDYYIKCAKDFGHLAPVCKYHDYFTSALRNPQRGQPAAIPLNGIAPVYAVDDVQNVFYNVGSNWYAKETANGATPGKVDVHTDTKHSFFNGTLGVNTTELAANTSALSGTAEKAYFNNLVADLGMHEDLSKSIGAAYSTINDLRYAFATQTYLEKNNRYGTRYREYLFSHYGSDAANIELQDPEFLGRCKMHIQTNQVVQTSSTDDVSPQGNVAAYSLTTGKNFLFKRSFTEFGTVHILACVRTKHTYQQGLNKMFTKRSKFDYYHPEFANISEQPILQRELYISGSSSSNSEVDQKKVFGFQEAWAEYRYFPDLCNGQFATDSGASFDIWHYADYYEEAPHLSAAWIAETYKNVDRTLAVTSELADQFKADFYFDITHVEPMPLYSIPGLGCHF